MPPKKAKKAAGGNAGSKTKETSEASLQASDLLELEKKRCATLEKEIEIREDRMSRYRIQIADQKAQIDAFQTTLDEKAADRLSLTSEMSRMYKTMQSGLDGRIKSQEAEIQDLRARLSAAQQENEELRAASERMEREKDATIEDQHVKMTYMSNEFEQMLNDALGRMTKKIELVSSKWRETDKVKISDASMRRLADFQVTSMNFE
ncbi:MAG: hypothetical protein SGCHY_002904 [Lobulomycetales sp.]